MMLNFKQRRFKIIHIDMDCFYAQVEMRDNPALRELPIAIGGPTKTQGILCTSNYKAREFGVRAAQSTYEAFKLCPELVLIHPDFAKYKLISNQLSVIYRKYSEKIQLISLDEAYIDVTDSHLHNGSATLIAQSIKNDIFETLSLTASAGVSFNKMLAKIASDWNKPNGLFVITPDMRDDFMKTLPLIKIPGVGKVGYEKLKKIGLSTCGDVVERDITELINLFGKRTALKLLEACHGVSNAVVKEKSQRKSFGIEKTFYDPIYDNEEITKEIDGLVSNYNLRLAELDDFHFWQRRISHVSVKIRFNDFETLTRAIGIPPHESDTLITNRLINKETAEILKAQLLSMHHDVKKPIRLIGIGIKFEESIDSQLELFSTQ
ncbi:MULTISPECIES: DNA polymerase IV [Serratia]|uniref:DNA polymerase IV n=1 Tax=Serratia TaxID=613 RepID=UPI000760220B|nr:DNA polymerase IV [Serratia marcescens]MBF8220936.1 DNA polymerase IV [Serratia ureilytica]EJD6708963.1 DNA polymerase IV [Serratia marcescens]EME1468473.1 DNA polymerase IV [Serratia marcescens]MBF4653944.1 DNA polymerase IV [Serratia marcescens]MBF8246257.1 DNA polymerase IV [Serratia ureilytica]